MTALHLFRMRASGLMGSSRPLLPTGQSPDSSWGEILQLPGPPALVCLEKTVKQYVNDLIFFMRKTN